MTATETALQLAGEFTPRRQGLEVLGDVTEKQWRDVGAALGRVEHSMPWLIGDWLIAGEQAWGKTYDDAMEITGLSYQTLVNAINVCRRIEFNRRRLNLSFKHHAEVASLPMGDQDKLLDAAESGKWSTRILRAQVRALKGLPANGHSQDEQGADEAQQRKSGLPVEYPRDADLIDGLDEDDLDECVAENDVEDAYRDDEIDESLDDEFSDGDADEPSDKDQGVVEPSRSQEHQDIRAGILQDLSRLVRKWKRAGASTEMILQTFQEWAQREHESSQVVSGDVRDSVSCDANESSDPEAVDSECDNRMDEEGGAQRVPALPAPQHRDQSDECSDAGDAPVEGVAASTNCVGGEQEVIVEHRHGGRDLLFKEFGSLIVWHEKGSPPDIWTDLRPGKLYDCVSEKIKCRKETLEDPKVQCVAEGAHD